MHRSMQASLVCAWTGTASDAHSPRARPASTIRPMTISFSFLRDVVERSRRADREWSGARASKINIFLNANRLKQLRAERVTTDAPRWFLLRL